jgi:hypothetical protein
MGTKAVVLMILGLAACGSEGDSGDVTIIRGAPETEWLDLTIDAEAVDAAEGTPVLIQLGMPDRPPERLGSAELTITGGGFSVHFPSVWEYSLYKRKVILLDHDGDGACSASDTVVVDYSAAVEDVAMTWASFFAADCEVFVSEWPTE